MRGMRVRCDSCGWYGERDNLVRGLCPKCGSYDTSASEEVVFFNTSRSGYSPDQCGPTMTVAELVEQLSEFDEDSLVFFRNDDGYTYGHLSDYDCVRFGGE